MGESTARGVAEEGRDDRWPGLIGAAFPVAGEEKPGREAGLFAIGVPYQDAFEVAARR